MKQIVRLTRIFRFEMAHALSGHKGLCKHIHGHSYQLEVTISGQPDHTPGRSNEGMVLDFGDLKTIVQREIIAPLDHALMLKEGSVLSLGDPDSELFARVVWTPWQPTCENMVVDFAQRIIAQLPEAIRLCRLKLYETHTSYAEWYASDNAE
ncbi:6-pyruvoyl trahydropterin synthase family protein [Chitinophaga sp. YR627]|uniref:6-pyruvoyl trahydropterin synthase family protein n=1 Tax=Chitinophaga sp. YR627 TaxID=1881041 RepID=UPI000B7DF439|nr:6-carboxytetrahydropterin synthase [Chitinophaga sp. YR627]